MEMLKRWCVAALMIMAPLISFRPQPVARRSILTTMPGRHRVDLLDLLAACEGLRQRFNADRLGVGMILRAIESGEK